LFFLRQTHARKTITTKPTTTAIPPKKDPTSKPVEGSALGVVALDGFGDVVTTAVVLGEVAVGVEPVVTLVASGVEPVVTLVSGVTVRLAVVTVILGVVAGEEGVEGEEGEEAGDVVGGAVEDATVDWAVDETTVVGAEVEVELSVVLPTKPSSRIPSTGTAVTVHDRASTHALRITN